MTLPELQKSIIKSLEEEGILTKDIKSKILRTKSINNLKNFQKKIKDSKRQLLKKEEELKFRGIEIWFDSVSLLKKLDKASCRRTILQANEAIFSFDKKKKTIEIAIKYGLPDYIVENLKKCQSREQIDEILEKLPPILLDKTGLKKLKSHAPIFTKLSIRAISTGMRD